MNSSYFVTHMSDTLRVLLLEVDVLQWSWHFWYIAVGDEPFLQSYGDQFHPFVIGAAINIQTALTGAKLANKVKVVVPCSSDTFEPESGLPSKGNFRPDINKTMIELLTFLNKHHSPFFANISPFLSYHQNKNISLDFALFKETAHPRNDSHKTYKNSFDLSYDIIVTALSTAGFPEMEIVIGQIGWPTDGAANATPSIAETFMKGLMDHLHSKSGTPLRPHNSPTEIYIFSLLDEDQRSIVTGNFERHWGIFTFDGQAKYRVDFGRGSTNLVNAQNVEYLASKWCVVNNNMDLSNATASALEACSVADCSALSPGGSCFNITWPGNISYAFNSYYQQHNQRANSCDFGGASSVVPYTGARCGHHPTLAWLGQRFRPNVNTERVRRPFVTELRQVTTTDECPPKLSPSLPPRCRFLMETPTADGRLPATPQRHGLVSHPLTTQQASSHTLSSGIKENTVVLTESRFSETAPAAILTIVVLAGKTSQVSRSGGQSFPRSRRTAAGVYPRFPFLFLYNNNPTIGTVCESKEVPACSMIRSTRVEQKEATPRYQTPFSREIKGLDSIEKFTPPRFTLYDSKSDPRSNVSHVRKMMALWNHMDALMCRFSSIDRVVRGPICHKHQGTEGRGLSVDTEEGKEQDYLQLQQWYGETYNEINEFFEELDLMFRVKIFARLEDDARQAEKITGTPTKGEGQCKKQKENPIDFGSRARQRINVLVRDGHLKEFIDEGKTQAEKDEAKPYPRFDRGRDDEPNPMANEEEDLPLGAIHMIGGPNHPDLENRIRGEIQMVRQMHKVLSVHLLAKKPRVVAGEPGSLTFTKDDLDRV
ncbi:O-Glycosyl hydrolases family 17 protein [Actinidia rufa]|uniref:O-Glycosyl hydrolases family 17 protein n=1 Tax=Actinidia rufa TaxID=165716 RepID=A0A7J0H9X7_9ERIC|nr:O-Glycosyl hydrolases family 17 protein [Actinidia rufa]